MAKAGELTYLSALPAGGKEHAENKPFSDMHAGRLFVDVGMVRMLLPKPPCRLLDLGCGTGWTSCFFAKMGYEVVGQDIAPDMIQSAIINKQRYGAYSANFVVSDYESMKFDEEFDAACFYDALHHAEDEHSALSAVYRSLKPGGILVTHEPGEGHSQNEHTIRAMEAYGVTEKDMPPSHILNIAREIGFTEAKHFPFPGDVIDMLMRQKPRDLSAPQAGVMGVVNKLRETLRDYKYRLRTKQRIAKSTAHAMHRGGIVVLTK